MDDKHAEVVIKGLLSELRKSAALIAAQRAVITQYVGDKWDTEISRRQEYSANTLRDEFERLYQMLILGAPESNPTEGWENIVRRLIESAGSQ